MKAIVCDTHGGPEVLRPAALPRPTPTDSELLIRVVSAAVARIDTEIRAGQASPVGMPAMPWVPGFAVAGVVEELGTSSRRFRRGDRVWACSRTPELDRGCYAEFVSVHESAASVMPNKLLFEEASAIPLHGLAAWQLLETLELDKGARLTVHGATGGVGHLLVQMCRQREIVVTAICASEDRDFLLEQGATATRLPTDHDPTGDRFTDAVVDLRPGGPTQLQLRPNGDQLGLLAALVDQKRLEPCIRGMLPLKAAADAHRQLESEDGRGVLTLNL
ncbi:MAG: NADP-dependent oxidoreductase [Acidobacteriota bacterium]|nr:NADP-dependent oxidoreductase [Acidobacteriota bacterium]MDH3783925.1 NADP-dependent oxidoreductase [Acidobacteriota bacterium]